MFQAIKCESLCCKTSQPGWFIKMNRHVFRNSFHFDIKGVLLLQKKQWGVLISTISAHFFHTNIKLHLYLHHFLSFLASISLSDLSSAEQSEHGFQGHKMLAALLIQPLTLGPGLMLTSHVENSRAHTEITHGKYWGLQGDMGWRMIRLDALHLSLWMQA